MNKFPESKFHDPVPTSYAYSAIFFAIVGMAASVGSILVVIAGVFAFWRIYVVKNLSHIPIHSIRLVWIIVAAYYGAGVLSAAMNPTDEESVAQLFERLPFLFLPLLLQIFSQANPEKLLLWAVRGSVFGVFGVVAYWGGVDHFEASRITAFSGNSNVFGYICSLLFVILCLGCTALSDPKTRFSSAFAIVLCFFLVAYSGSRASLISIILIFVLYICYLGLWRKTPSRVFAVIALVAFAFAILSLTVVGQRSITMVARVIEADMKLEEFDPARIAIWTCGIQIGFDTPIFGQGHDKALEAMKVCTSDLFDRPLGFSHFHNLFIDQFAKGGVFGAVSALLLLLLPIFLLFNMRKLHGFNAGIAAGILGIWIVQFTGALFNIGFGHDVLDTGYIYCNALLFGVVNARLRQDQQLEEGEQLLLNPSAAGAEMNYIKLFSLGCCFTLVFTTIAFLWVANSVGFNRFTIASGGYALPAKEVSRARSAASELLEFVNRLEAEIIKSDSAIDLPNTERFYSITEVWHDEYTKLSGTTRELLAVSVRKSGEDYKILLSGPICPIAVSSGLFEVDPRRRSSYATLCLYFSVWSGEGQRF